MAVQSNMGTFLVELSEAADGIKWDPDWAATVQKKKRDKEKELATEKVDQLNIVCIGAKIEF